MSMHHEGTDLCCERKLGYISYRLVIVRRVVNRYRRIDGSVLQKEKPGGFISNAWFFSRNNDIRFIY